MNKAVILKAHLWAIVLFLVIGLILAVQGRVHTQNSNSQNRNANSNTNARAMENANANMQTRTNENQGTTAISGPSNTDRKFMSDVAMDGMAEVELGKLATERGASDAVKQFGQRMVDDHSKANSELTQIASSKGMTLPTAIGPKHQAKIDRMSKLSGEAFDRAYAKDMVSDHQKAVKLFEKESTSGTDADLKAFATSTLPTLREHLQMARGLNVAPAAGTNGNMNSNSRTGTNSNNSNR